jgi:hypothetical protein
MEKEYKLSIERGTKHREFRGISIDISREVIAFWKAATAAGFTKSVDVTVKLDEAIKEFTFAEFFTKLGFNLTETDLKE